MSNKSRKSRFNKKGGRRAKTRAKKRFIKVQIGDVYKTHAEIKKIKKVTNYSPKTKIEIGLKKFINWYKTYYLK